MPNAIPVPAHDAKTGMDPNLSTSPMEGSGAYYAQNSRSSEIILRGRVDDTYPANNGCLVAVYAMASKLPCVIASDIHGRIFGAHSLGMPTIGTEVLVYIPTGSNFGYILGILPTIEGDKQVMPRPMVSPEGGVNSLSSKEAFNAEDWNFHPQLLPDHGAGSAIDVLPGDHGVVNDLNLFVGLLRMVAVLKGSELSKVEAFLIDDLLRITGYNLEEFTSCGERRHSNVNGMTTSEEFIAFNQNESLGMGTKGTVCATDESASLISDPEKIGLKPVSERMTGKWRYRQYVGFLGDLFHRIISRPTSEPESLNTSETPDAGVFSEHISRAGNMTIRSLGGMGLHKVDRIPVPKRKWFFGEPHDKTEVKTEPVKPFSLFDDNAGPASAFLKLRDYFSYKFSALIPARMYESADAKELSIPENSECVDLANINSYPGSGGFFRDFPDQVDLSRTVDGIIEEPIADESKVTPGNAWVDVLPDGSISMRDIWGSAIEMRGGHIYLSASKGIQMLAGDSVVTLAGQDIIGKAKQSIDMTSTSGQVRIKSQNSLFLHSEKAGVQITCPSKNAPNTVPEADSILGEAYDIPGLVIKSGASTSIISDNHFYYLKSGMYITNQDGESGSYPVIYKQFDTEFNHSYGSGIAYKFGKSDDKFAWMKDGSLYATGDLLLDGMASIQKTVASKTLIGNLLKGGPSNQKALPQLKKSYPKDTQVTDNLPFKYDEVPKISFIYRSDENYGTLDGKWFESDWQRDLSSELEQWKEEPPQNDSGNESYPYPGKENYTSQKKYYTYQEVNVKNTGEALDRKSMSESGGEVAPVSWNEFKI